MVSKIDGGWSQAVEVGSFSPSGCLEQFLGRSYWPSHKECGKPSQHRLNQRSVSIVIPHVPTSVSQVNRSVHPNMSTWFPAWFFQGDPPMVPWCHGMSCQVPGEAGDLSLLRLETGVAPPGGGIAGVSGGLWTAAVVAWWDAQPGWNCWSWWRCLGLDIAAWIMRYPDVSIVGWDHFPTASGSWSHFCRAWKTIWKLKGGFASPTCCQTASKLLESAQGFSWFLGSGGVGTTAHFWSVSESRARWSGKGTYTSGCQWPKGRGYAGADFANQPFQWIRCVPILFTNALYPFGGSFLPVNHGQFLILTPEKWEVTLQNTVP